MESLRAWRVKGLYRVTCRWGKVMLASGRESPSFSFFKSGYFVISAEMTPWYIFPRCITDLVVRKKGCELGFGVFHSIESQGGVRRPGRRDRAPCTTPETENKAHGRSFRRQRRTSQPGNTVARF